MSPSTVDDAVHPKEHLIQWLTSKLTWEMVSMCGPEHQQRDNIVEEFVLMRILSL